MKIDIADINDKQYFEMTSPESSPPLVYFVTYYANAFDILSFDTESTVHARVIMELINEARLLDANSKENIFAMSKLLLWLYESSKPKEKRDCWHADRLADVPVVIPDILKNAVSADYGRWDHYDHVTAGKLTQPVYLYNNGFR